MSGGGYYVALSGAIAQNDALDTVSSNLANVTTPGFRAERTRFEQVLGELDPKDGARVRAIRGTRDESKGPVTQTGAPLDLMIEGPGHFVVSAGTGLGTVRTGHFQLDAEGRLVDPGGRALMSRSGGPIQVPPETRAVNVDAGGTVHADGEEVGRLLVVTNPTPASFGDALAAERPDARVVSGAIEGSNVNIVRGMVDLIQVQRTFETLTRMIEGYKAIDDRTARDIGNPR